MKHFSSHLCRLNLLRALLLAGGLVTAGAAHAQTPSFAAVAPYSTGTGSNPRDIATADLNGDGRLDLITTNTGSNSVGVLLGSASGLFATAVTYATGNSPVSVAVADINGDGKLDVVTANQASNTVGVLLGTGTGTLQPMQAYRSGSQPSSIAIADVDGDSRPDILTANTGDNAVGVLFSRGGVAFSSNTNYSAGDGSSITSISVAYVNGDNILDVVTASPANGTAGVLLGSQTFSGGSFSLLGNYPAGRNPVDVAVADVNRDGKPDLLTAGYGGNEVGVLLGSGTGISPTFSTVVSYPISASPEAIAVADVNGDGQLDLVTTNDGYTASLLLGKGAGTFQTSTSYATGSGSAQSPGRLGIAIADVNGDGQLDLLTANAAAVGVLLNTTVAVPTLTSLNPTSGPVGTNVTLTGTNLTGATAVRFNGTAATTFAVVNATTATAIVPAGATSGNVTVTTALGTSTEVAFTVTQPTTATPVLNALPSPSSATPTYSGTAAAGSTVRVYVDGTVLPSTAIATQAGTFSLAQPTPLATGSHNVYATAQTSSATVSSNSSTLTFTVDATPPTVTIVSLSGTTTSRFPIVFRITFSESVFFDRSNLQNNLTNSSSTVLDLTNDPIYTLQVYPNANGSVTLTIPANSFTDRFGNRNTTTQAATVVYTGAPVLNTPANGSVTNNNLPTYSGMVANGGSISINVDNSIAVTGTSVATGGGPFSVSQPSNRPLADGIHTVYARGTDPQQGNTFFGVSNTNTFTVDTTPPTVAFSSPAVAAGGTISTAPIPVTVTFSESVTGFAPSDIVITNGTLTGVLSGGGASYSFSVTPTGAGTVTVNVAANAAQDAATNGNTAAPAFGFTYSVPLTATLTTWTGAVSTDWFTAGNWSAGVPTTDLDVVIAGGSPRYPVVTTGELATSSLAIGAGATLTQTDGTLTVTGDLTNNGTFTTTNASGTAGGTVTMGLTDRVNGSSILGSSPIRFWNFLVATTTVQLSTSAGASVRSVLTLNGNLATQGNRLTLESNNMGDALVVNIGGAVIGATAVVQRYIDPSVNAGLGYRHYSAPVSNTTVADLATSSFMPVVNPAYNSSATPAAVTPFPTVYGYNQALVNRTNTSPNFDKGFFSPAALSDPLAVGSGYTVNIDASEFVDFVGTLNNNDIRTTVSRNAAGTLNNADAGWQFLGNPYPAPLDYSKVEAADRTGLADAMYVYSSTSQYLGTYRAYVNDMGGNPVLPVGQGFFMRMVAGQTTGTFTFRNSQRLTSPDQTAFQRTKADVRPQVQLELRGSTGPADVFIAYAEANATPAFDNRYDAAKLPNPTGLNLASLAVDGESLAIDGRSAFVSTTVLPLTVGVPAAGTYSFKAAALLNLPTGLSAYLTDTQTGQTVSLATGTNYSFSVTATEATALISNRFQLAFRPATALATAASFTAEFVSVYPNPAHERFTVVVPGKTQATTMQAELLNALGQVVRRQSAALPSSGTQLTFDTAALATGVYTLRLQVGDTTLAKRVILH